MRQKNIFYIVMVAALAFFLSLPSAHAAKKSEGSNKVGVFDMQRIIRESKAGQKARVTFEKELAERRNILVKKEKELRGFQQELRESKGLEPAERREKEKQLAKDLKELRRLRADLEEELKNMDKELTLKLLKDVIVVVKAIGQKEKFSVIFQKSPNMIYIDEAIDITSKVLKRYDTKFKK